MYAQDQPCDDGIPVSPSSQSKTVQNHRERRKTSSRNIHRPGGAALPLSEEGQRLSALFPNGWDWLYADHRNPGPETNWETIKRYPLTPIEQWSLHQDPTLLIGIRPLSVTRWAILDIDRSSPYHPAQNPAALQIIRNTLEDIGITRTLLNQSRGMATM